MKTQASNVCVVQFWVASPWYSSVCLWRIHCFSLCSSCFWSVQAWSRPTMLRSDWYGQFQSDSLETSVITWDRQPCLQGWWLSFCCIAEDLSLFSLEEVVCVSVGGLGWVGEVCVCRSTGSDEVTHSERVSERVRDRESNRGFWDELSAGRVGCVVFLCRLR